MIPRVTGVFLFCVILISGKNTNAQYNQHINDFNWWSSISIEHQVTRRVAVSLEEQLRLNQNAAEIDQYFTDFGVSYDLSDKFKIGGFYRFIRKQQDTYYSNRHRWYADLSFKTKYHKLVFGLRQRVQQQVEDVQSSETGKYPELTLRTKASIKLDLDKKYAPYVSSELYFNEDTKQDEGWFISKIRLTGGVDYKFNRRHSVDVFYMYQHEPQTFAWDFVLGTGYEFSF